MAFSEYPFLYPSVSLLVGIAPVGISKIGEGCPIQERATNIAQGYLERTFPPDSDKSICLRY